jgi:hypothetical protein
MPDDGDFDNWWAVRWRRHVRRRGRSVRRRRGRSVRRRRRHVRRRGHLWREFGANPRP